MIFDRSLDSLDGRFQEWVSVAWKLQHDTYLPGVSLFLRGSDDWLVSQHTALYDILLRACIRHRLQGVYNHLGI